MSEAWLSFTFLVFIQFILYIIHAYYAKKLSSALHILERGILIGISVGLISDIVIGKFFGLWSYTLGFGVLPLVLSAMFLYGIFAANTLLMQRIQLSQFFIWTTIVAVV